MAGGAVDGDLLGSLLSRERGGAGPPRAVAPFWAPTLAITSLLDGHRGCVNSLGFSHSGELLCSGSDDTRVLVWRPAEAGASAAPVAAIKTGHEANIFCSEFLPHTGARRCRRRCAAAGNVAPPPMPLVCRRCAVEKPPPCGRRCSPPHAPLSLKLPPLSYRSSFPGEASIATCSGDWSVKVCDIERGRATATYRHHGDRAKKLIVDHESPHVLLTCSEDGSGAATRARERPPPPQPQRQSPPQPSRALDTVLLMIPRNNPLKNANLSVRARPAAGRAARGAPGAPPGGGGPRARGALDRLPRAPPLAAGRRRQRRLAAAL
jgi:hypothetical protein